MVKTHTHFGNRKHTTLPLNKQRMWFHSKGHIFNLKDCVSFPTLVRIFVGSFDSCFLTHTKKYMTTIHATLFKNMSKCVFIKYILKRQCQLSTLWEVCTAKKSWQEAHFFRTQGWQGPGSVSPGGSSRAAPSIAAFYFFVVFQGSQVSLCSPIKKPV